MFSKKLLKRLKIVQKLQHELVNNFGYEVYNVFVNGENVGEMKSNMSGKLSISVELGEGSEVSVKITK